MFSLFSASVKTGNHHDKPADVSVLSNTFIKNPSCVSEDFNPLIDSSPEPIDLGEGESGERTGAFSELSFFCEKHRVL